VPVPPLAVPPVQSWGQLTPQPKLQGSCEPPFEVAPLDAPLFELPPCEGLPFSSSLLPAQ
jgi:hypothetical protein